MNRTHAHRTPNPHSAAPSSAGTSIPTTLAAPTPKCAPTHKPKNEAPHASSGVRSQPITTSAWASQRGTQALRTRENSASAVSETV